MHNITCNIIDHGHFALSIKSEHKPVYLYGDGRCSSYLTRLEKQAMCLIKIGRHSCDVEAIVKLTTTKSL